MIPSKKDSDPLGLTAVAADAVVQSVMPPPSDPGSGHLRTVGGIRLLRKIGVGAMSEVYLGYDSRKQRHVAVKLLADRLAVQENFVNRFYREARMSRVLSHPNLVHGFAEGYDPSAGKHFLILEYVDGPNTMAIVDEDGPLPVGVVVHIGIVVATALHYLHKKDYVHRDVKPENILIGSSGEVKLGDLGLAKRIEGETSLTSLSQRVGTPHYMPYEQSMNGDVVDARSDLFALGATMYHLLTGRVPFAGDSPEELLKAKGGESYIRARELCPDVPEVLDVVLNRTLKKDLQQRFPNAAQFAATLRATGLSQLPTPLEVPPTVEIEVLRFPDPSNSSSAVV